MNQMPAEVLEIILQFACDSVLDLIRFSHVCKHFDQSITDSFLWTTYQSYYPLLTPDEVVTNSAHGSCHLLWHLYIDKKSPIHLVSSHHVQGRYKLRSKQQYVAHLRYVVKLHSKKMKSLRRRMNREHQLAYVYSKMCEYFVPIMLVLFCLTPTFICMHMARKSIWSIASFLVNVKLETLPAFMDSNIFITLPVRLMLFSCIAFVSFRLFLHHYCPHIASDREDIDIAFWWRSAALLIFLYLYVIIILNKSVHDAHMMTVELDKRIEYSVASWVNPWLTQWVVLLCPLYLSLFIVLVSRDIVRLLIIFHLIYFISYMDGMMWTHQFLSPVWVVIASIPALLWKSINNITTLMDILKRNKSLLTVHLLNNYHRFMFSIQFLHLSIELMTCISMITLELMLAFFRVYHWAMMLPLIILTWLLALLIRARSL